jgi:formylglycine-generating enzyme required for sulfatase activity
MSDEHVEQPPEIEGFTHIGEEVFGTGRDVAMVHVYRHDLLTDLVPHDGRDSRLEFVLVPGATFQQGANDDDVRRLEHLAPHGDTPLGRYEHPPRQVRVEPFLLGRTPVTQEVWDAVARHFDVELYDQRNLEGPYIPVHGVNPGFVAPFLEVTGFRLPSEAEWEWAARGGTGTTFFHGNDTGELREFAWFGHVGEAGPMSVAQRRSNNFGLFDIVGNVWELCADAWVEELREAPGDGAPHLDDDSMLRVIRGGSFRVDSPSYLCPAYRSYTGVYATPIDQGFRVAASVGSA